MSPPSAFEDEPMNAETRQFLEAAARELREPPAPGLEAGLVPRLAAIAATSAPEPGKAPAAHRPLRRLPLRVGVAAAAVLASTAGLAVAGIKLPGPIDRGFEKIGIELPNQAADAGGKGEGPNRIVPAKDGTDDPGDDLPGAEGARGKSSERGSQGNRNRGRGRKQGRKGERPGKSGLAPGHNKPPGSNAAVPERGNAQPQGGGPERVKPAKPAKPEPPAKPVKPSKPAPSLEENGKGNGKSG